MASYPRSVPDEIIIEMSVNSSYRLRAENTRATSFKIMFQDFYYTILYMFYAFLFPFPN